MRLVIAVTGASGTLYAQRLLERLGGRGHELHVVMSRGGREVAASELGRLQLPPGSLEYPDDQMAAAPFISGSAQFDAMTVIPCSMGTLGRIAAGLADTVILRTADVFLKEKRPLVLVPRETPLSLVHVRNLAVVMEAGAMVIPAMPGFYRKPVGVQDLVDSVVDRVLDHLGTPDGKIRRWPGP